MAALPRSAQTKARLKAAQPGQTWLNVDETVRPRCHQNGYDGFTNVYGRMAWDQVSPTTREAARRPARADSAIPTSDVTRFPFEKRPYCNRFPETYRFVTDQMDACVQHDWQRGSATVCKAGRQGTVIGRPKTHPLRREGAYADEPLAWGRKKRANDFWEVGSRTADVSRGKHGKSNPPRNDWSICFAKQGFPAGAGINL